MNTERIEQQVKESLPSEVGSVFTLGKLTNSTIIKLAKTIVAFGEALCEVKLYPYQREFAISFVTSVMMSDSEETTGLFSRQSGKTTTVAVCINGMMVMLPTLAKYIKDKRIQKFAKGVWIGIFAPAKDQAEIMHSKANHYLAHRSRAGTDGRR